MKKKIIIALVVAFGVAAVVGGLFVWGWLRDNRLPAFEREAELYVREGTVVADVVDSLVCNAAPKWPKRLARVMEEHQVAANMKPGHYVVPAGAKAVYVARMLNNGWQTPVRMTLSGTLRRRGDIARKISAQMMVDSAEVRAAMDDPALLSEFGVTPEMVFAIFLPDTYEMYWTASVREILSAQKKALDAFWTAENVARAEMLGLSRMEVSVLASIVSGETNYVPEMPKIAGVYINRLRRGMKLQADPTVAFCYDYQVNRILKYMLSFDSPYNTYKYAGLPPAPICVPSLNTLEAVLNPDFSGGALYFCADPSFNGSHRFARTYSDHIRNARAFQRALSAR